MPVYPGALPDTPFSDTLFSPWQPEFSTDSLRWPFRRPRSAARRCMPPNLEEPQSKLNYGYLCAARRAAGAVFCLRHMLHREDEESAIVALFLVYHGEFNKTESFGSRVSQPIF